MPTPQQTRRNRILGLILLAFVLAVFGWVIWQGGSALSGRAGSF